jgi:hypothetical protein
MRVCCEFDGPVAAKWFTANLPRFWREFEGNFPRVWRTYWHKMVYCQFVAILMRVWRDFDGPVAAKVFVANLMQHSRDNTTYFVRLFYILGFRQNSNPQLHSTQWSDLTYWSHIQLCKIFIHTYSTNVFLYVYVCVHM